MPEAARVRVIPPIAEQAKKLRVCAYARVSSDSADQLHSFATQISYYTDLIEQASIKKGTQKQQKSSVYAV